MSLLDESETKVPYVPQVRQEAACVYPNTTDQEHGFLYTMFNANAYVSVPDQVCNEDITWDGLWNLDEVHGNFGVAAACASSKATMHNLVAPFC
ncbi:conserved hypothetical protein [Ricinus communis]|uniref:Uncharacterized protein n=3 Tax=Ricinus communis TaxID=3988 RepID=B9RWU0_RICCO|nr:conserved hypothetical protein [Ricinus communis]